ncbi:MAG TPA: L-aspartate oxidase [bacterium]|nr:L-aspartate oxidase [bacterium]
MLISADVLVIGTGIAGLSFALKVADTCDVALVSKTRLDETNTKYAQGGIAVVSTPEDSVDLHVSDTLTAGAGLCKEEVVRMVVGDGPARVAELIEQGVRFDRNEASSTGYDLHKEGGHTKRRILHSGDITGREIERALIAAVEKHPRIKIFEDHFAVDLITTGKLVHNHAADRCLGAYILNKQAGTIDTFLASFTVLATGGCGKVYLITSNPDVATGDGVAMAWRANAEVGNMEFIQFHPTCLYHPFARNFLISEAVRGEGAVLINNKGERFMDRLHPLKSLAPRDIVARAIDHEIKRTGAECVYLDISHLGDEAGAKFPNIHQKCLSLGIDMTKEPIPVAPAAHYMCGGVAVDQHGESTLRNLFAIGEVAYTGLHGANRLASNSLLEAVVYAHNAAEEILRRDRSALTRHSVPAWDAFGATEPDEAVMVTHNWEEVRRTMSNYLGIVRSEKRLARAQRRIKMLQQEIAEYYWNFTVSSDLLELRNIALVAGLIIRAAQRRESRGLHYRIDYPNKLPEAKESRDRRQVSWID